MKDGLYRIRPVDDLPPPPTPPEPLKRFTIDVPETLHKRIKTRCASRGRMMADVIREILEREFPAS